MTFAIGDRVVVAVDVVVVVDTVSLTYGGLRGTVTGIEIYDAPVADSMCVFVTFGPDTSFNGETVPFGAEELELVSVVDRVAELDR